MSGGESDEGSLFEVLFSQFSSVKNISSLKSPRQSIRM